MELEMMDANRKKIKIKTQDCSQCGKPMGFQSPDGIGFRFLPPEEPYCACYKPKEPKITEFPCGCKQIVDIDYEGHPTTINEKYCDTHQRIADQKLVGKDGFIATGKIRLDTTRMKVIPSTAKQQLARHKTFPIYATSNSKIRE